jgi:CHASE2 domain-containing sensor protein
VDVAELKDQAGKWAPESSCTTAPLIDFVGPSGTFYHLSARVLMDDPVTAAVLAGRVVIIGITTPESGDTFVTPFDALSGDGRTMSGVEVQANCVATLLPYCFADCLPALFSFA